MWRLHCQIIWDIDFALWIYKCKAKKYPLNKKRKYYHSTATRTSATCYSSTYNNCTVVTSARMHCSVCTCSIYICISTSRPREKHRGLSLVPMLLPLARGFHLPVSESMHCRILLCHRFLIAGIYMRRLLGAVGTMRENFFILSRIWPTLSKGWVRGARNIFLCKKLAGFNWGMCSISVNFPSFHAWTFLKINWKRTVHY